MLHGLVAIVRGGLAGGRHGHEKACVEALGQTGWRQPVAVIRQAVHRQAHAKPLAELRHARAAAARGLPQPCLLRGIQRVQRDQLAAGIAREQQAGFLETLAHGCQVEIQAAVRQLETGAGRGIVQAGADIVQGSVLGVERAAGKDEGAAAAVVVALGAAHQQHFHAGRAIAHYQDACGLTQRGGA